MGREAVSTFYYAIDQEFGFPEEEFPQRPLEVLAYLKRMLGESGYALLEITVCNQIKQSFKIDESSKIPLSEIVMRAKVNYMQASL